MIFWKLKSIQEERSIYEGTFTQDTYDCNIEDGSNDNFFPQINHETERGPKDRRDIFQREINQMYGILNSLNDDNFDNEFLLTLKEYINKGRTLLQQKNKNNIARQFCGFSEKITFASIYQTGIIYNL